MIHTDLKKEMQEALKAKEEVRLSVIRGLLSAFTNELVTKKRKPDGELSDEEAMEVISRGAKQRKDSIEQFRKGGREDLAQKEEEELKILENYLPEMMSCKEIEKIAQAKKEEMGVDDKAKMGMLMGAIMKELKGKANGEDVKTVVEGLF
ncbi:MAG TPA: GatB/YqeY domain-containing protein [Candidatus Paceibacterota bacterium]|jgi:hypothetical protein|nr:GatB/YqeY domain-containing protein [Candidatus Paceibacterota bacterium]HJN62819.1 GatB/YqeY domain-containing protein [Candidatus Paceibacterota bacterium]|tara:strand:+ start:5511 stop:5960 length:450 start_codon:yes stop_codon:yes gene_type:complete